jgi:lysozyme
MELSKRGAAFVGAHEGWRSRYYLDPVGIPTIGYGFTWRSAAFKKWWAENRKGQTFGPSAVLSRKEGDEILVLLFAEEYGAAVNKFLGKTVPQHVFDAMASVTFNCGAGCLKWKWAQAAKAGNYTAAAELLKTTAVTARGKRLQGLVHRRAEEAGLLLRGDYGGVRAKREPSSGVMSKGSRGGEVLAAQNKLRTLGYYDGALDGNFGVGTEAAVLAFQSAKGLAPDGVVGPQTLRALDTTISEAKKKNDVVKDAARSGASSTTNIATGIGAASSTIAIAKEATDAAKDSVDGVSAILAAGPWVLLLVVSLGAGWWIWRERQRKAKAAQAAKAVM